MASAFRAPNVIWVERIVLKGRSGDAIVLETKPLMIRTHHAIRMLNVNVSKNVMRNKYVTMSIYKSEEMLQSTVVIGNNLELLQFGSIRNNGSISRQLIVNRPESSWVAAQWLH